MLCLNFLFDHKLQYCEREIVQIEREVTFEIIEKHLLPCLAFFKD